MYKKTKPQIALITAVITAFMVLGGAYIWNRYLNTENTYQPIEDKITQWDIYESENGFSFQYPEGHVVSENVDPNDNEVINVFIARSDENGEPIQGPPVLQINVSSNSVSFSLWEGMPWDGYPEIVSTFKMK